MSWLSELRELLPHLPRLQQVLLLAPPGVVEGSAVALEAIRALVGCTLDRPSALCQNVLEQPEQQQHQQQQPGGHAVL